MARSDHEIALRKSERERGREGEGSMDGWRVGGKEERGGRGREMSLSTVGLVKWQRGRRGPRCLVVAVCIVLCWVVTWQLGEGKRLQR